MRFIYILRHCVYDQNSGPGPNFDCDLSPQGHQHAMRIGALMKTEGVAPDLIYCSGAVRTRQTLDGLVESIEKPEVTFNDEMFGCMPGDLLDLIQKTNDQHRHVLLIGHNPAMHGLAHLLGQKGALAELKKVAYSYPPGTLTAIRCNAPSWLECSPTNCEITEVFKS